MVFSGTLNWGPVEAIISIYDIVIRNDRLESFKAKITVNGQTKELSFGSPLS